MPDRNLLDELMKLLNQPGPVNWALASQLADHLSGPPEPLDPWLAEEYLELARYARLRLTEATGVRSDPMAEAMLLDRKGWARHNLRSFWYIVEPLAAKLAGSAGSGPLDAVLKPLGPALLGMQMGAMVGMMSDEVLGLFDAGLPAAEPSGSVFVVSNIEAFAAEYGLDARQVRLWSALHEVAHDALAGRAWFRPHLIGLFKDLAESMELDPGAMAAWHEELADPAKLEARLSQGGGFAGLFGGPLHDEHLEDIRRLLTVVDGYGAYLVERASSGLLPDLPSIRNAMSSRQQNQGDQSMVGGLFRLEPTAGTHGPAAAFCTEVADRWGETAVHRVWERPENLPVGGELTDATGWAARVLLDDPFNL